MLENRFTRRRIPILGVLVALGLLAGVSTAAATPAPAAATHAASQSAASPLRQSAAEALAASEAVDPTTTHRAVLPAATSCATIRAHFHSYAAQGHTQVGCLTAGTPANTASPVTQAALHTAAARLAASEAAATRISARGTTSSTATPAAQSDDVSVWCSGLTENEWWEIRTSQCLWDNNFTYTLYDTDTGELIGSAVLSLTQVIESDADSLTWTETDTITVESEEDEAVDLSPDWITSCTSAGTCSPASSTPFSTSDVLVVGDPDVGSVTFSDEADPGPDYDSEDYSLAISQPDSTPVGSSTWNSADVRCDDAVGTDAGCIMPDYIPTYPVSLSTYGSSAAMIQWAQDNLSGHWGLQGEGEPLERLANASEQNANRTTICNSTFTADPSITDDSCDEYPFAATYQSGALNGVDSGSQCAQVTADEDTSGTTLAQQWPTVSVVGTYGGSEACVRGHIPLDLNTGVGSGLGLFAQNQRLLDGDQYWVAITD